MNDLTSSQLSSALDSYYEKTKSRKETKNIATPHSEDFVVLNTIYLSLFLAMDQLSINNFDVEHIAPKEQMKKLLQKTNNIEGFPISCISNLCYLLESANRSKGTKNFYQDTKYLDTSKMTIEEIESKYSFTDRSDIDWMDLEYDNTDFLVLKEFYINFLDARYLKIKRLFLKSLGFITNEADLENNAESKYIETSSDNFNEKFYRLERIGILAKKTITHLILTNKLSDDEIRQLQDREYSIKNLGVDMLYW